MHHQPPHILADGRDIMYCRLSDIGHKVGEVELEVDLWAPDEKQIKAIMTETDSEITRFLRLHDWAFDVAAPVRILSAYLARKHQAVR